MSEMNTAATMRARVYALIMREIVCEQVFREREKWSAQKPVTSLSLRTLDPSEIAPHLHRLYSEHGAELLSAETKTLKEIGAEVLDAIAAKREAERQAALEATREMIDGADDEEEEEGDALDKMQNVLAKAQGATQKLKKLLGGPVNDDEEEIIK